MNIKVVDRIDKALIPIKYFFLIFTSNKVMRAE